MQRLEGEHVGFLWQITRKKSKKLRDGLWWQATAKTVLQVAWRQPLKTDVDMRQAKVAEWVDLGPILDFCVREMGYEVGERLQVPWWSQAAAEKQLMVAVEAISATTRVQRRQESGRCGWSEIGSEGGGDGQ